MRRHTHWRMLCYGLLLAGTLVRPAAGLAQADKKLVLFPLVLYTDPAKGYLRQGLKSILKARLSGGGLEVLTEEAYRDLLTEKELQGLADPARAEALTRRMGADFALLGTITAVGKGYSLDLTLLEIQGRGARETRVSEAAQEDQFIPRMADVGERLRAALEGRAMPRRRIAGRATGPPETAKGLFSKLSAAQAPASGDQGLFFRPARTYQSLRPSGQMRLDRSVVAFDLADLDGDKQDELVVIDRKNLLLYQWDGAGFRLRDRLAAGTGEDFLRLSAGDGDGNGRAEIYLVSRYGIRARSTVYAWGDGFRRLHRQAGHLQAVREGKRIHVLFQDSKVGEFLGGPIYRMHWEEAGKLARGERLPEFKDVRFYTLAAMDLDQDGVPEWLGLGRESRLCAWNQEGDLLWQGQSPLGGSNNAIHLGQSPPGEAPPRIAFESRLLVMDVDEDGQKEVLAIRNIPLLDNLRDFVVYNKAALTAYRIQGSHLEAAWTTGEIPYAIADMQAQGRILYLAALKGKVVTVKQGASQIMWFE